MKEGREYKERVKEKKDKTMITKHPWRNTDLIGYWLSLRVVVRALLPPAGWSVSVPVHSHWVVLTPETRPSIFVRTMYHRLSRWSAAWITRCCNVHLLTESHPSDTEISRQTGSSAMPIFTQPSCCHQRRTKQVLSRWNKELKAESRSKQHNTPRKYSLA